MGRLRRQQRTIEQVRFDGAIGLVTAQELLSARESLWRHWRDMLTQGNQRGGQGYKAKCHLCEGRVYIRVVKSSRGEAPAFWHFKGEGIACPWHTGEPLNPEHVRKLQYGGEQESLIHRELCKDIHGFVSADARCTESTCNQRVKADENDKWKVPDVYAKLDGYGRVAIELQLSNTFQTEIAARTSFYNAQGIGLLWVFHRRYPDLEALPTSLKDVVHKQRGNAFLMDYESPDCIRCAKVICAQVLP